MGWRGPVVLRRNAAVALGNTLDRAAVPALERALVEDAHPLVRGHAAWALGRLGSPYARALTTAGASVALFDIDDAPSSLLRALLHSGAPIATPRVRVNHVAPSPRAAAINSRSPSKRRKALSRHRQRSSR